MVNESKTHSLRSKTLEFIVSFMRGPVELSPKFPFRLFYITSLIAFSLTVVIGPFAAIADKNFLTSLPVPPEPEWLNNVTSTIFLDPFLIHLIAALFASVMIFIIAARKNLGTIKSISVALTPLVLVIVSHIFVTYLYKPSFDFPRPVGYSNANEPPIVKFYHNVFGYGGGVPSGFVVRQMVLFYFVLWLSRLSDFPLKKSWQTVLINILNLLGVVMVAFLRIYRNSHTFFDITISIAAGTMIFWVAFVLPYILFKGNSAVFNVGMVYMLFVAELFFYTQDPRYWILTSFGLIGGMLLLYKLVKSRTKEPAL